MNFLLLLMRVLHIALGVFWAGSLIFNAVFLVPAMRDAGPDAAKVMAGLMRRRFLDILPIAAALTILSGVWLYWHDSVGFQADYMRSSGGMTIGVGAAAAIVAFILGVSVMRTAMLRAASIVQALPNSPPQEREARMAEAQALRVRAAKIGRIVAALLTVTVFAMAIARYV